MIIKGINKQFDKMNKYVYNEIYRLCQKYDKNDGL